MPAMNISTLSSYLIVQLLLSKFSNSLVVSALGLLYKPRVVIE